MLIFNEQCYCFLVILSESGKEIYGTSNVSLVSMYMHDTYHFKKNSYIKFQVKEETLMTALTSKKTVARGETLVMNFRMSEAIATRDAVAKSLYGTIFDWIVLQINHALRAKRESVKEHHRNAIGVLDIFGFEDFACNYFEQFNINYANEQLQYYFNQHVFRFEQEEYIKEEIAWNHIDFIDNTGCLSLISGECLGTAEAGNKSVCGDA